jgi:hypothetical protein
MRDNTKLRRMVPCGKLRRVALVRTDDSDESFAFIIRMTRIGELGTTLAVTSSTNNSNIKRLCISSQRALVASYG